MQPAGTQPIVAPSLQQSNYDSAVRGPDIHTVFDFFSEGIGDFKKVKQSLFNIFQRAKSNDPVCLDILQTLAYTAKNRDVIASLTAASPTAEQRQQEELKQYARSLIIDIVEQGAGETTLSPLCQAAVHLRSTAREIHKGRNPLPKQEQTALQAALKDKVDQQTLNIFLHGNDSLSSKQQIALQQAMLQAQDLKLNHLIRSQMLRNAQDDLVLLAAAATHLPACTAEDNRLPPYVEKKQKDEMIRQHTGRPPIFTSEKQGGPPSTNWKVFKTHYQGMPCTRPETQALEAQCRGETAKREHIMALCQTMQDESDTVRSGKYPPDSVSNQVFRAIRHTADQYQNLVLPDDRSINDLCDAFENNPATLLSAEAFQATLMSFMSRNTESAYASSGLLPSSSDSNGDQAAGGIDTRDLRPHAPDLDALDDAPDFDDDDLDLRGAGTPRDMKAKERQDHLNLCAQFLDALQHRLAQIPIPKPDDARQPLRATDPAVELTMDQRA